MKIKATHKRAARRICRLVRNTAAVIGAGMVLGAIGTDDIYVKELVQASPDIWTEIMIGFALLLPTIVHIAKRG